MRRRRLEEWEGGREARMRDLRVMIVVRLGSGMSRSRSGREVVKRIVRGKGASAFGGGVVVGSVGSSMVVVVAVLRVRVEVREDVGASWPVVELGGVACNANQWMREA